VNIQVVTTEEGFRSLRNEWNDLLQRSEADTVFLTWEWAFSWWQAYGEEHGELQIFTVREGEDLIAICPLFKQTQRRLPLLSVAALHVIGDGSWDSDYLDVILLKGREDEILTRLWKYLMQENRGSFDLVRLLSARGDSPTLTWLNRMMESGQAILRTETVTCAMTDLPSSWEDFLASMQPRFRTKVRSTLRELRGSYEVNFRSVDSEDDLPGSLEILFDLHRRRWALKGGEGVFGGSAKRNFYRKFSRRFLKQGWLAFDLLELNGKSVACQMCFRYRGTQYLLQEGFDPEFASESVGIALRALVFQKAIQDGVRQYDFLGGTGRHKTRWNARLVNCYTVSAGRRSLPNTIYLRGPVAMSALRERVKALLPDKVLEIRRRFAAS
jgi:CelD/BcsL family acetyltransferase involved in cellulose biosynthesis